MGFLPAIISNGHAALNQDIRKVLTNNITWDIWTLFHITDIANKGYSKGLSDWQYSI